MADEISSAAKPRKTPDRSVEMVSNTYLVVGPKTVFGKRNGETFYATLTVDQEKHLIEAGHITVAPAKPRPTWAEVAVKEPKEKKKGPSA